MLEQLREIILANKDFSNLVEIMKKMNINDINKLPAAESPMKLAVEKSNWLAVLILFDHGVNIHMTFEQGETLMDFAAKQLFTRVGLPSFINDTRSHAGIAALNISRTALIVALLGAKFGNSNRQVDAAEYQYRNNFELIFYCKAMWRSARSYIVDILEYLAKYNLKNCAKAIMSFAAPVKVELISGAIKIEVIEHQAQLQIWEQAYKDVQESLPQPGQCCIDPDIAEFEGNTVLHHICSQRNKERIPAEIQFMLNIGAKGNIVNEDGETPCCYAMRYGTSKFVLLELAKKTGEDLNNYIPIVNIPEFVIPEKLVLNQALINSIMTAIRKNAVSMFQVLATKLSSAEWGEVERRCKKDDLLSNLTGLWEQYNAANAQKLPVLVTLRKS